VAPASKRAHAHKGKRARVRRATRDYLNVTVDPHTVDRLDMVAGQSGVSRGRIVDAAILLFVGDYLARRVAFCREPGCARVRPDTDDSPNWACEEHGP
jgi:hypothetical protein